MKNIPILLFSVLILGCISNAATDKFEIYEKCITENFTKGKEVHSCLDGLNYTLESYRVLDTTFYLGDFKGSEVKVDSVPIFINNAFGERRKVCIKKDIIDFKTQNSFWIRNKEDSIMAVLTIY